MRSCMPTTCNYDGCDGAVSMTGSNNETNPTRDRVEFYECEYGHEFTVTLEAGPIGGYGDD